MTIPKMRTIKESVNEIKKSDPETKITESAIRRLVNEGKIYSVSVGRKKLIDLNECINYFSNPYPPLRLCENKTTPDAGTNITRMKEFKKNIGIIDTMCS